MFSVANAVGGILGGVAGHFIWKWRVGVLPVFAGVSVWLGIPGLLWLINADVTAMSAVSMYAIAFFAGVVASVAGVEIRPLLMNCNEPEARGIVLALQVCWLEPRSTGNVAMLLPCSLRRNHRGTVLPSMY